MSRKLRDQLSAMAAEDPDDVHVIKSCSCCIEQTSIGVLLLGTKKIHFQDLLHALVAQSKSDFIVVVFFKDHHEKIVGI